MGMGKHMTAGHITDVVRHDPGEYEFLTCRYFGVGIRIDRAQHFLYDGGSVPAIQVRDDRFSAVIHVGGSDVPLTGVIQDVELAQVVTAWLKTLKNEGG